MGNVNYKKNNRCSKCGKFYPKEQVWCPDCGKKLKTRSDQNQNRPSQIAVRARLKQNSKSVKN